MTNKSVNGGYFVKPDKNRKISMRYKDYSRHVKAVIAATVIATSVVIGVGKGVVEDFSDHAVIDRLCSDFRVDCLNEETHRTNDGQHYFYDYADIVNFIKDSGDEDMGIYLFNKTAGGEYQTNKLLGFSEYDNLDGFLKAKGFDSMDEFNETTRKKLIIQDHINDMLSEIDEINASHDKQDVVEGGQK